MKKEHTIMIQLGVWPRAGKRKKMFMIHDSPAFFFCKREMSVSIPLVDIIVAVGIGREEGKP